MFDTIDVRGLAEMEVGERAVLTVYLQQPRSLEWYRRRVRQLAGLLACHPDELDHLEHNVALVEGYLEEHPLESGGLMMVACWALDELRAYPLELGAGELPIEDCVWVDSSPYVRPLARLQDAFETYAVVSVDNSQAHVYLVTAATAEDPTRVVGDIKNQVKKGGWSQQRYKRRRERALGHYADEIIGVLRELDRAEDFGALVVVGERAGWRAVGAGGVVVAALGLRLGLAAILGAAPAARAASSPRSRPAPWWATARTGRPGSWCGPPRP